ncbi:hypothetical protein PM082_004727 [Marasmius tenuissimus]|nr:hypothetical protein PM082_004727 [Marasmius tenuissimus]
MHSSTLNTLLTIAKRFEKLENWTVGHVRALEERTSDVERSDYACPAETSIAGFFSPTNSPPSSATKSARPISMNITGLPPPDLQQNPPMSSSSSSYSMASFSSASSISPQTVIHRKTAATCEDVSPNLEYLKRMHPTLVTPDLIPTLTEDLQSLLTQFTSLTHTSLASQLTSNQTYLTSVSLDDFVAVYKETHKFVVDCEVRCKCMVVAL